MKISSSDWFWFERKFHIPLVFLTFGCASLMYNQCSLVVDDHKKKNSFFCLVLNFFTFFFPQAVTDSEETLFNCTPAKQNQNTSRALQNEIKTCKMLNNMVALRFVSSVTFTKSEEFECAEEEWGMVN